MSSFFSSSKMAGVEQMDIGIRQIALERLGTASDERVSFHPRPPKSGSLFSQPCLPRGQQITAFGQTEKNSA
jgi:hypothetical protein